MPQIREQLEFELSYILSYLCYNFNFFFRKVMDRNGIMEMALVMDSNGEYFCVQNR